MTADRKSLLAVVAELNEKRDAGIKAPTKLNNTKLAEAILAATDNGQDLKKLTKEARAIVTALVETAEPQEHEEASTPAEPQDENSAASDEEAAPAEPQDLTSREALNLAAQDMNDVMGLEPGIDTTLDDAMFMKAFTKAADMATGTDNFKDFTWRVLEANQLGPERVLTKPVKKASGTDKAAAKKEKAPKVKKEKAPKGPGVIATIREFVAERATAKDNSFTLAEILEHLVKTFPQRDEDSLMATIRTQVPGRVRKELGYGFEKLENGKFKVTPPAK